MIATVGESPAVITEAIDEFGRSGIGISRVILLYTKAVSNYVLALKFDFKYGMYQDRIKLDDIVLPFDDIRDEKDIKRFRNILFDTIKKERENKIYLLIAGGRKSMVVDFTIIALAFGIDKLYYVRLPPGEGVIQAEHMISNYNLKEYLDKEVPKFIIDKIIDICHPRLKGNLISIQLPLLEEYCKNSLFRILNNFK